MQCNAVHRGVGKRERNPTINPQIQDKRNKLSVLIDSTEYFNNME